MSSACSICGRVQEFVISSKFEFENLSGRECWRYDSTEELLVLMRSKIGFEDTAALIYLRIAPSGSTCNRLTKHKVA
jgi:hypothetical protein